MRVCVLFQSCSCKNTCSRKSGRKQRGCPCRDEGLHCTEQCKCGTKKAWCKNKDSAGNGGAGPPNENAGQNAFERHKIAVYEAKQYITVGRQLDLHNNLPFLAILACVAAGHVDVLKYKYTFNSVSKRQNVNTSGCKEGYTISACRSTLAWIVSNCLKFLIELFILYII